MRLMILFFILVMTSCGSTKCPTTSKNYFFKNVSKSKPLYKPKRSVKHNPVYK